MTALVEAAPGHAAPLEGKVVVIDPGHNPGNAARPSRIARQVDAGTLRKACDTVGAQTANGYPEWRHNLRVARRLARILRARGADVTLTHDGRRPRWGPCINRRARIANRLDADVAISIHADGHTGRGRGFHIIHPAAVEGLTDDIAAASGRLARDLRRAFRRETGLPLSNYAGRRGLHRRTDIGGLNLSDVPKVLVEAGNLRDERDASLLTAAGFQWREARGLADGLSAFLTRAPRLVE
ncbi:MAG: N-acetylmuramoyl-L-alanine amidase [Gaiellaceae bacterium]